MRLKERMKMKLLLLLCCCFSITSTGQEACDTVPEGKNHTLPLEKGNVPFSDQDLQWKHNEIVLVNRKKGRFSKGSEKDIDKSGSLLLTDLKKTSSGKYKAEVYNAQGQEVKELGVERNLCVTDRIPKPSVTFVCMKKSLVTLTCNISQSKDLSFKWSENGKVVAKETKGTLLRQTVDKAGNVVLVTYTCTVSKLGGDEPSPAVTPICPQEPESIFPEKLFGFEFWTMVGILASGGALLLTLIIITICCCSRARRRKRKMLIDEQEFRLYPHQQQQQPHQPQLHLHSHQQPAGHTGPRPQHRSKAAQERERTRGGDPDAPKLPKPRGGGGGAAADPSAPKLPKPRGGGGGGGGGPGGDPSAPKLPRPRGGGGGGDPSGPRPPHNDPLLGGDLSAPPKLPSARASPRLPAAEVGHPGPMDEGAPLGPRPGDPGAGDDGEQPPPLPQPRKKGPRAQRGGPDPYAGLR